MLEVCCKGIWLKSDTSNSSPSHPCHFASRKMALSPELAAIVASANAPAKFSEFLVKNAQLTMEQVGLWASTEGVFEEKTIPMLQAGGVPTEGIADMVSLKKVWMTCRACMDRQASVSAGRLPSTGNTPIAVEVKTPLDVEWKRVHGFTVPGDLLVTETLMNTTHSEHSNTPRKFGIHLMETIRLQSSIEDRKKSRVLSQAPGEPMTTEEIEICEVSSLMDLYARAQAFFYTYALVCILNKDFFPYQDCVYMNCKIYSLLQTTIDGRHPPLSHFIMAWARTMQYFADEVRTNQSTLGALVRTTSSWTAFWSSWSPSSTGASSEVQANTVSPSRMTELEKEVARLRTETARLQSQRDRALHAAGLNKGGGAKRPWHDHHDNHKGKKGKGKGHHGQRY